MADELDTVWSAKRHTLAKHSILKSYLGAWTAILGRVKAPKELRIFDAFAGPGIYEDGEPGSPILALQTVQNHTAKLNAKVRFTFIENDLCRFDSLQRQVQSFSIQNDSKERISSVKCFNGDCVKLIESWLSEFEQKRKPLGPAFFFLDQFGYSQVPFDFVTRIMRHSVCECFIFMEWSQLRRFITDPTKKGAHEVAFGGPVLESLSSKPNEEWPRILQVLYADRLRESGAIKYVWSFAMRNENNAFTHWLFFCTNSDRGLEEMKKAMLKVDPTGAFSFSDNSDPKQFSLLSNYDEDMLRRDIVEHFRGMEANVGEIRDFVLSNTPRVNFKGVLKSLEQEGAITILTPPPGRQSRTYKEPTLRIRFNS